MFIIQIIEKETGKVKQEAKTKGERVAIRVEKGININLNHEKYYTRIKGKEKKNERNI